MKIKIFTFPFDPAIPGFDDHALQEFMADKEVIAFSEHFYVHENLPYLTVLFSYRVIEGQEGRRYPRRDDPREDLDEAERAAYEALRGWRGAKAQQEGIPPYMIATNRQIAKMVKLRAATKADLRAVGGIGETKIERHGDEILAILAQHLHGDTPGEARASEEQPS